MTAAILASTTSGATGDGPVKRHIVAVRPLYGGTDHLLDSGLLGVETTFCSETEVAASVRPDTGMVVHRVAGEPDPRAGRHRRRSCEQAGDVPVLVDNTFATPVLQNPLAFGAAMALHSATKYLGGHGDVIGGVIACSEEQAEALRRVRAITGGAAASARRLPAAPRARDPADPDAQRSRRRRRGWPSGWAVIPRWPRSHYPGLDGDPRGLHRNPDARDRRDDLDHAWRGGFDAAQAFTAGVRMFSHAVSLGGVESLLQHPASLTHRPVAAEAKPATDLVRLSIGLEGVRRHDRRPRAGSGCGVGPRGSHDSRAGRPLSTGSRPA